MTSVAVPVRSESIVLPLSVKLSGDLEIPAGATSLVLFAHGSGSSRRSPRNQWVAAQLQNAGYATLLLDLLTDAEETTASLNVDLPMLAQRLVEASDWTGSHASTHELRVGYFGGSTGAAAAIIAAASRPDIVRAIVSRGGRPDLAGQYLGHVHAPTRLIVGALDRDVVGLNRSALARLGTTTRDLIVVPGASHLFEEPGTLARVATLAIDWFGRYLASDPVVRIDDEC
jgi:putative phosphoribosyl transferase